jgi:glycerol-3-phosphate dehydrogenase
VRREERTLTADDLLWRRIELGLHFEPAQRDALADWLCE